MPSCVVKCCKNYSNMCKKLDGITFHTFPRDRIRRDEWMQIIRTCRGDNNWNPSSSSTVCSAHFDEVDFKTTAKGLRCLTPYAFPKRLLSKSTGIKPRSPSPTPQIMVHVKCEPTTSKAPSSPQSITSSGSQVLQIKEELTITEHCRLCAGLETSDKLLSLQSDISLKKLVIKMLSRLNTAIDFDQQLPTNICLVCVKSLYTAYDFVGGIEQAQVTLYNIAVSNAAILGNTSLRENLDLSSTQTVATNIKVELSDQEQPNLHADTISLPQVSPNTGSTSSNIDQSTSLDSGLNGSFLFHSPRMVEKRLKEDINTKNKFIINQKKKLKILQQRIRRLQRRNEILKNILKNTNAKNIVDTENIVAEDLFNILIQKKFKKHIIYSQTIKKFCLKLNYYSPRAYDYIRQSFDTCLPHRTTLAKWYGHINDESGASDESFQVLGSINPEISESVSDPASSFDENA